VGVGVGTETFAIRIKLLNTKKKQKKGILGLYILFSGEWQKKKTQKAERGGRGRRGEREGESTTRKYG
jgi:hypothetical protein